MEDVSGFVEIEAKKMELDKEGIHFFGMKTMKWIGFQHLICFQVDCLS